MAPVPGEHSRAGQRLPGCGAYTGPKSVNNYMTESHENRELSSEFHHWDYKCQNNCGQWIYEFELPECFC